MSQGQREEQTRALAGLGFGESFLGGDWMSPTFASCERCGAVVRLLPGASGEDQPVAKHHLWHEEAH